MNTLKDFRQEIKSTLVVANVLPANQIIIHRQSDEWEVIKQAIAMAEKGVCLHIAEAEGTNIDPTAPDIVAEVDLVLTLFCETVYHPNDITDDAPATTENPPALSAPGAWHEEDIWIELIKALHGKIISPAGATFPQHCDYALRMTGWRHVPNDFDYYARATTFKFKTVITI